MTIFWSRQEVGTLKRPKPHNPAQSTLLPALAWFQHDTWLDVNVDKVLAKIFDRSETLVENHQVDVRKGDE